MIAAAAIAATAAGGGDRKVNGGITWGHSVDEALASARKTGKPVMIDFMATWCPPCHAMEDSTFSDSTVIAKAGSFVPVRIDVDAQRDVAVAYGGNARKYGGIGIPNILFLDTKGATVRHIVGYYGPGQLVAVMDSVLAGK
jgi:thiol:disulfide interchange protein